MKWKVCGMRDQDNIRQVMSLKPDFMGFIFYKRSPRYVGNNWEGLPDDFPSEINKVGVFVNESLATVIELARKFQLQWLQLHGDETVEYCRHLFNEGFNLLKVIHIEDKQDLDKAAPFTPWVEYFLLDTKSPQYGGTGKSFNWDVLSSYKLAKPFLLSGGISLDEIAGIQALEGLPLVGIDVNSRFETEPGRKDFSRLSQLQDRIEQL